MENTNIDDLAPALGLHVRHGGPHGLHRTDELQLLRQLCAAPCRCVGVAVPVLDGARSGQPVGRAPAGAAFRRIAPHRGAGAGNQAG